MIEVMLTAETGETRERNRQQVLRDRVRDSLRWGNPRVMTPIEDTVEDVSS